MGAGRMSGDVEMIFCPVFSYVVLIVSLNTSTMVPNCVSREMAHSQTSLKKHFSPQIKFRFFTFFRAIFPMYFGVLNGGVKTVLMC